LGHSGYVVRVVVVPGYGSFIAGAELDDSLPEFIESLGSVSGVDH